MSPIASALIAGFLILVGPIPGLAQKPARKSEALSNYYKNWLEKDVAYIIAPEEKEVFSKLQADEERDQFIEQFWARRDPDPNTVENEFKEEHYRRIRYADERFTAGKPGWRTDRGRVYIRFGKPDDAEAHTGGLYSRRLNEGGGTTSVYPFERWTYRHIDGIGDNVEIEFVDSEMTGNYELALDAEEKDALLLVGWGQTWDEMDGKISRDERIHFRFYGNPNNLDLQDQRFRYRRLQDEVFSRVEQFMKLDKPPVLKNPKLRELVTSRVTFPDVLPMSWSYSYYKLNESQFVVPLALKIQNRELGYEARDNGVKTATVVIYARITGLDGRVYFEFDDTIYSHYGPQEFEKRSYQYSVYQKMLPLAPGRYKVDLLAQNENGKRSGLVTFGIVLPQMKEESALSPLTVSHYLTHIIGATDRNRQFVLGDMKVVPAFDLPFKNDEKLGIYLQGYGYQVDSTTFRPDVKVRFQILGRNGIVVRDLEEDGRSCIAYHDSRIIVAKHLPLSGLSQGKYKLKVTVENNLSGQQQSAVADFEIAG